MNSTAIDNRARWLTWVLFIVYLLILCWIILLKMGVGFSYMEKRQINLVPFANANASEMISNVIIFLPLGVYAGVLLRKWSFAKKLLFFVFLSAFIEVVQFGLAIGALDVTDIIANTSGALLGLLIYSMIWALFKNDRSTERFIHIMAGLGTVLLVTLLWMLKANMLPIRYQ